MEQRLAQLERNVERLHAVLDEVREGLLGNLGGNQGIVGQFHEQRQQMQFIQSSLNNLKSDLINLQLKLGSLEKEGWQEKAKLAAVAGLVGGGGAQIIGLFFK